ncbi:MAG: DNA recombination protein RmuC [Sulfurimonas sp.]|uniref:DNA recombination protein RmuC n=1 Tax=Sulfurimonas sp. TaxID=2022749 RepID=UPI002619A3D2|nr:DNA recombination protein RmuC [Sulfurimonas sp.]MCW8894621.1 DNA recombination protein RmuC [Sulfurimonas sp.]MCW8955066.1 DNA recombination protein RmuC [Sulfurimonas sp.]MCW9066814.1 DNA recombination protein RmuC [Sulfurimonas sp.]
MFSAIYTVIGIIFGALAVWIISVRTLKDSLKTELEKSTVLASQNAVLQERINGLNEKNQEKIELLQKNKEQMTLEFKELANKILESNSEKFSTQNQENLSKMITPIKEQFSEFKKQIDDVYIKEAKDRSMLQAEIKSIKEINHQMSKDAKNLTSALKGESKKQGVWGEMVLQRVLENSGLREGEEYKREVSMEHESDGSRYRPDVVVHLPDTRDIIIDAKTSLTAYEQYTSSADEEQKEIFASEHLASMKKHIKELSQKDYTNLKGVESLDFIFMFVPIESALLMALEYDSTLFDHAFKKNVILVGPTTLMVSLRAVENTWKYEHQQRNAQEIAQRAGLLYDKFIGFIDSVERLGKQIGTVQKTYDEAFSKMHSGAGSITSQFQKLQKLGAATSKKLPEHINKQLEE